MYICAMRNLYLAIFCMLGVSCLDQPPCLDSQNNRVEISFKSLDDNSDKTITIDSIYISNPLFVVEKNIDIAGTAIPLFPDLNEVLIVIESSSLQDSIKIQYEARAKLYSRECDVEMIFDEFILDYTTADSIRLNLDQIPPQIEIVF